QDGVLVTGGLALGAVGDDDVAPAGFGNGSELATGRKAGAAATAQSGTLDGLDERRPLRARVHDGQRPVLREMDGEVGTPGREKAREAARSRAGRIERRRLRCHRPPTTGSSSPVRAAGEAVTSAAMSPGSKSSWVTLTITSSRCPLRSLTSAT